MGKLIRSKDKMLGGVCAGIAEHFKWNTQTLRFAWLILAFVGIGCPVVLYILLWILMPDAAREKATFEERINKRLGK